MDIASTLHDLGEVYQEMGELDRAEGAFARARRHFEDLSLLVGEPAEVGTFQESLKHFYERYAYLLLQRHRPEDALVLAESGRAQGLARQLVLNGADFTRYFTKEEAEQLKIRTVELTVANRLRRAAQSNLDTCRPDQKAFFQKQLAEYDTRCQEAERQYTLLRDALFAKYPQFRQVQGERPPTIADLKALARQHPDTLYLEWVLVDEKTTLLFALSHKDGLRAFTLPVGDKTLRKMAKEWRVAIAGPGGRGARLAAAPDQEQQKRERQQARALYDALFGPLEKAHVLPIRNPQSAIRNPQRLVFVANEPLLDIPFAALMDSREKRLVERYALSSAIALGIFLWRDNPLPTTASLLCVADPLGQAEKPRQIASRRGSFGPLPFARAEGKAVARLFGGAASLVGPAAREGAVKQEMARYAVLHFATHGSLDDRNSLRSGLIFAPEPEGSKEDGVLEAREIVERPVSARLAVLSACETARGEAKGGEGLVSLAWAFRAAGCPSVVASQWQVEDAATERLMVGFYEGLRRGQRKDEALRSAMLGVRKEGNHEAPYYWAAFQVIGDTAPLALPASQRRPAATKQEIGR